MKKIEFGVQWGAQAIQLNLEGPEMKPRSSDAGFSSLCIEPLIFGQGWENSLRIAMKGLPCSPLSYESLTHSLLEMADKCPLSIWVTFDVWWFWEKLYPNMTLVDMHMHAFIYLCTKSIIPLLKSLYHTPCFLFLMGTADNYINLSIQEQLSGGWISKLFSGLCLNLSLLLLSFSQSHLIAALGNLAKSPTIMG